MIEDSAQGVTNAKAAYEARLWLKHYPSHVGPEITPQFTNGLDMFLKTVQDLPEQAAIHYFDQTMSYGELDRKSSALAAALKERGVTHGDRIALYLQNIPQFLIGLYGAWKVGAITVLCNPMLKHHELEYHLTDSGAKGLICLESLCTLQWQRSLACLLSCSTASRQQKCCGSSRSGMAASRWLRSRSLLPYWLIPTSKRATCRL